MNAVQILLRIVHILCGIFWVGATVFTAAFLLPALGEAGPDGAKVMAGIIRRKFMEIMPIVAVLTMGSGLWLLSRASVGFSSAYFSTRPGMAFSTGGACAIIGFAIGMAFVRPSMQKAGALSASAATAAPEEKAKILAAAGALRARASKAGNVVAVLLVIAATAMAVARYL